MTAASQSGAMAARAPRFRTPPLRALVSLAALCAVLAGCASASDVTAADKQGMLTVSAQATGGSLAWARAHRRAQTEANAYCASRGMQTSFATERTNGFQALQQQGTVIEFECHPKL